MYNRRKTDLKPTTTQRKTVLPGREEPFGARIGPGLLGNQELMGLEGYELDGGRRGKGLLGGDENGSQNSMKAEANSEENHERRSLRGSRQWNSSSMKSPKLVGSVRKSVGPFSTSLVCPGSQISVDTFGVEDHYQFCPNKRCAKCQEYFPRSALHFHERDCWGSSKKNKNSHGQCPYCFELHPLEFLIQHKVNCLFGPINHEPHFGPGNSLTHTMCPFCDRICASSEIESHIDWECKARQNAVCQFCERTFNNRGKLKKHQVLCRKLAKNHSCSGVSSDSEGPVEPSWAEQEAQGRSQRRDSMRTALPISFPEVEQGSSFLQTLFNHRNFMQSNRDRIRDFDISELFRAIEQRTHESGHPKGVSSSLLTTFKGEKFKSQNTNEPQDPCSICLCDYKEGDPLRVLPCKHKFHKPCIDIWLAQNTVCPLCKRDFK